MGEPRRTSRINNIPWATHVASRIFQPSSFFPSRLTRLGLWSRLCNPITHLSQIDSNSQQDAGYATKLRTAVVITSRRCWIRKLNYRREGTRDAIEIAAIKRRRVSLVLNGWLGAWLDSKNRFVLSIFPRPTITHPSELSRKDKITNSRYAKWSLWIRCYSFRKLSVSKSHRPLKLRSRFELEEHGQFSK